MPEKKISIGFSASSSSGEHKEKEPWLIPDEAFSEMRNVFSWRNRLMKRLSPQLLGRMVTNAKESYASVVAATDTSFTSTLTPDNIPIVPKSVSIVLKTLTYSDDGNGVLSDGGSGTGTINYITGIFTINFTPLGDDGNSVFLNYTFFPILPVMGIVLYELPAINSEAFLFFDTKHINQFTSKEVGFSDIGVYITSQEPVLFSGNDMDFFSGRNYEQSLFVTNGVFGNHITAIISATGGSPDTTIVLANNIFKVGDFFYVDDILGTIGTDETKGINGKTFTIKTSATDTITFEQDTSSLTYNSKGYLAISTRSSSTSIVGQISAVTPDVPSTGKTQITTTNNVNYIIGQKVFFRDIVGSVGDALNGFSFVITDIASVTTFSFFKKTTGLAWTSGGIVYVKNTNGPKLYFEGSLGKGFANFNPLLVGSNSTNDGTILKGAQQFISYKSYMFVIAPTEGTPYSDSTIFLPQRIRYSQIGTPFYTVPVPDNKTYDPKSWRSDISGRGGFIDLPSSQKIIKAEYIKDTILVFCERSIWELQETGIGALPFIFKRINVEFGVESQFSTIPFDDHVIGIGQRGIIASSLNEVARIDQNIPYKIFDFLNTDGIKRVHAGRDYYNELVFWNWNDGVSGVKSSFPNRLLVYNYREGSFSEFNDQYTCFGPFQYSEDILWKDIEDFWEECEVIFGGSNNQSKVPNLAAGNNNGYCFVLNKSAGNPPSLAVSEITKASQAIISTHADHVVETGFFVELSNVLGMTEINGISSEVEVINSKSFRCLDIDSSTFSDYVALGEISVRSSIKLVSKRFSPFVNDGYGCALKKMSLLHDKSPAGTMKINIFNFQNPQINPQNGSWQISFSLNNNPSNLSQKKLWSNFIVHVRGEFVQFEIVQSKEIMLDRINANSSFILHSIILHTRTGGRIGNF